MDILDCVIGKEVYKFGAFYGREFHIWDQSSEKKTLCNESINDDYEWHHYGRKALKHLNCEICTTKLSEIVDEDFKEAINVN